MNGTILLLSGALLAAAAGCGTAERPVSAPVEVTFTNGMTKVPLPANTARQAKLRHLFSARVGADDYTCYDLLCLADYWLIFRNQGLWKVWPAPMDWVPGFNHLKYGADGRSTERYGLIDGDYLDPEGLIRQALAPENAGMPLPWTLRIDVEPVKQRLTVLPLDDAAQEAFFAGETNVVMRAPPRKAVSELGQLREKYDTRRIRLGTPREAIEAGLGLPATSRVDVAGTQLYYYLDPQHFDPQYEGCVAYIVGIGYDPTGNVDRVIHGDLLDRLPDPPPHAPVP